MGNKVCIRWLGWLLLVCMLLFIPQGGMAQQEGGESVLLNGSFEDWTEAGRPEGWRMSAWINDLESASFSVDRVVSRLGGISAKIVCPLPNDARFEQEIPVNPNSLYRISGWIRAQGIEAGEYGANLSAEGIYQQVPMVDDTGGAWRQVEWYGRTSADQHTFTLMARVGFYGNLVKGTAWFDDIEVTEVDAVPAGFEVLELSATQAAAQAEEPAKDQGFKAVFGLSLLIAAAFTALILYARRTLIPGARDPLSESELDHPHERALGVILLAGLVLRLVLSLTTDGYQIDVNCFTQWGLRMAEVGPRSFYAPDYFCDYPPGMIWLLGLQGLIVNILGSNVFEPLANLVMRLPANLSDIALAILLYRWSRKQFGNFPALCLAALVAFNPALIMDGAVWGQMDSVWVLIMVLALHQANQKRYDIAAPLYALCLLIKPQALMMGPVVLCVLLAALFDKADKKRFIRMGLGALYSVLTIGLISLPFWLGVGRFLWLFELYGSTVGSYPYASLNAYNLFALLGGNWVDQSTAFLGFTYATWGNIFLVVVIAATALLVLLRKKKDEGLFLASAFLIAGVFILAPRMHERYLFPAIPLLIFAYLQHRDRRLLWIFGIFSITQLVNMQHVLVQTHIPAEDWALRLLSLANVLAFIWMCVVCVQVLLQGKSHPIKAHADEDHPAPVPYAREREALLQDRKRVRFTRKDALMAGVLMAVYAIIALLNLGTGPNPESYFRPMNTGISCTVTFDAPVNIRAVAHYAGIGNGAMEVTAITPEGEQDLAVFTHDGWSMFKWYFDDVAVDQVQSVRFNVTESGINVMEVAFIDESGNPLPVGSLQMSDGYWGTTEAAALFDEQHTVPKQESYLNTMYFDEVYHARTAYEHIHRIEPYEITHPPLGKILISIGIQLFGMNAFGWRIVGTVFGILMVPLMYLLTLRLFKKSEYALMAAFIFAFDNMHFGQTRIATIDVYAVFFILLMYYFMFRYLERNFHRDPLWKTLIPLGLAGIAFGLGAASKWTCIYAGAGLAVLFFRSLYHRWRESVYARRMLAKGEFAPESQSVLEAAARGFAPKTIATLLFCIVFFILIPVVIYGASYYPYMVAGHGHGLEVIWDNQKYMLNYHSKLVDSHSFASPWWEWPLMLRPIWYYKGTHVPEGMVSTINGMGNPIVWWGAFAAFIALVVRSVRGKKTHDSQTIVLIALGSQFLPWVLVPRSTFIYHYFASLPFLVIILVYILRLLWEKGKAERAWVYVYLSAVLIAFALFYPMVSGMPVSIGYAQRLRWLPWWILFG